MVRLALIGCDTTSDYVAVLPRVRNAEIVATVDDDGDKARWAAETLGAQSLASIDKALASDLIDATLVHARDGVSVARQAANAGKHVFLAGIQGSTVAQVDEVIGACESAGVKFMVGLSTRYHPSQQTVKKAITSGDLGELGLVRIHHWEAGTNGANAIEQVTPDIDVANWLFKALPSEVYATGGSDDYLQVHLGFPNGGMALIDYASSLPDGGGYFSLSVIGSTGAATADDHHNVNLIYRGGKPLAVTGGQGISHVRTQLQEFVDAIGEQRSPATSGMDGRNALLVADAAEKSVALGRSFKLEGGAYELA
ncbi:MAG: Gfo/Idh/MocA family oxidoreductase [Chloroflexi bacterium]|nr:Gfo/Idh/MocA family oxidoreductase [Chloroflexota bacterium]